MFIVLPAMLFKTALIGFYLTALISSSSASDTAYSFNNENRLTDVSHAQIVSAPFEQLGPVARPVSSGQVEFSVLNSGVLTFDHLPADFEDDNNIEFSVSGPIALNVVMQNGPIHAFGIRLAAESPEAPADGPTLVWTAKLGSEKVAEFTTIIAPSISRFFGIWSTSPFDRVEVRETGASANRINFGAVFGSTLFPPAWQDRLTIADPGSQGLGSDVALEGSTALVSSINDRRVYVFEESVEGGWDERGELLPMKVRSDEVFGAKVLLTDQYAVVSAPGDQDDDLGAIYLYARDADGQWLLEDRVQPASKLLDVALDGSRAVTAEANLMAQIFERSANGTWVAAGMLSPDFPPGLDRSNMYIVNVALSGDTAALAIKGAAMQEPENKNAVLVFERQVCGTWLQVSTLVAPESRFFDFFGGALDLDGHRLIAVAPHYYRYYQGTPYVFERQSDGTWEYDGQIPDVFGNGSSGPVGNDIALDDDWLVLSATTSPLSGSSGAHLYHRDSGNQWNLFGRFLPVVAAASFTHSVAIDGSRFIGGDFGSAFVISPFLFADEFESVVE